MSRRIARRPLARRRAAHAAAQPLAGRRILITRPRAQSRLLAERLRRLGARPIVVPAIGIEAPRAGGPLDRALRNLHRYDWVIVTSANGAQACLRRAQALGLDLARIRNVRWAAIGPATAAALRQARISIALMPARYLTEAIAEALPDLSGRRILLPRTNAAGPALAQSLRRRGATVDEIVAYRTVIAPGRSRERARGLLAAGGADTVVFTSASTVHGLVRLLGQDRGALRDLIVACIGPITAAAAVERGLAPTVVADEHTVDGLVRALVAHHAVRTKGEARARDRASR